MPDFAHPFTGNRCERKLTKDELIRAIRYNIAAEYEAIQLYMQLAESIDDKLAREILTDVANEERQHVGEFLRLLHYLDPEEQTFYDQGKKEVEEEMEKLGIKK